MQNKNEFIRKAVLQIYTSPDWAGSPQQAIICAEQLYKELQGKGYGFAEMEPVICPACKGTGVLKAPPRRP